MSVEKYDSTAETLKHIKRVNELLIFASTELLKRAVIHDQSKLMEVEKTTFDEFTPKLKNTQFGSDEYKQFLVDMKPALENHYSENSHHPEHYPNGINDFDLFDLIEMFLDWKASTERTASGDIMKSIQINKDRFQISDQICSIFENTVKNYGLGKRE